MVEVKHYLESHGLYICLQWQPIYANVYTMCLLCGLALEKSSSFNFTSSLAYHASSPTVITFPLAFKTLCPTFKLSICFSAIPITPSSLNRHSCISSFHKIFSICFVCFVSFDAKCALASFGNPFCRSVSTATRAIATLLWMTQWDVMMLPTCYMLCKGSWLLMLNNTTSPLCTIQLLCPFHCCCLYVNSTTRFASLLFTPSLNFIISITIRTFGAKPKIGLDFPPLKTWAWLRSILTRDSRM